MNQDNKIKLVEIALLGANGATPVGKANEILENYINI